MSVSYYDDFPEDATVNIPFNTFSSNDPSASVTITDLVDADIKVHKDAHVDQIITDGATVVIDFDGITGNHMINIDTSVDAAYTTGSEYQVRIEGTTVDGATINAWVGSFSIERAGGVLALIKAGTIKVDVETIKTQAVTAGAGITIRADVGAAAAPGAANGMFIGGTNAATIVASLSVTGQLDAGNVVVDAGMDVVGALSANSLLIDTTTVLAGNVELSANLAIVGTQTNTGAVTHTAGLASAITGNITGDLSGSVGSLTGHTNQTANNNVILAHADYGNAKLARTGADSDTLETLSDQIDLQATAVKLLKYVQLFVRSDAAIATDNATELTAINANGGSGVGDFSNQTDAEEALRDRGDSAWTTGAGGSDRLLMVDTTIATLASQTSFTLAAGSADDNAYNNCTIIIEDVSTAAQKAVGIVSDYIGGTKTITLKYDPAIFTMATTDKVYILAENALKSTLANRQLNVAADGDIAGNVDGSVASVVGHTVQTGDGYAILNNGTHGNAALETLVDEIETILKNATYGNSALQVLVAALQTDLDNGTDGLGALKTLIDTVNTDLSNGTDGLGALKTLIDTNKTELDGLQGTDGKALVSTDAQDLSGTLDVNAKTATATALDLILEDSTFALAIKDAVWNAILTGTTFNIASSAGRRVREIGAFAIHSGTAQAGSGHSITLDAGASASDGIYNRNLIVLTDNTGAGQTRTIVDYNGTTKVCVIDRDWRVSPDATTEYQVVPDDTPLTVDHGVAQGGTSTTITIRDYASSVDDAYLCNIVTIIAGKGRGQARLVGAYNGTTKVVTICGDNWVETPDATSIYVMMPYGTTCTSCIGTSALGQINAEVVDVLKTDTKGEPAQGAPGATLSIEDKIAFIYKFLRNQVWTTETEINVYNNAADTVDHKSTISDDGTTFKRGEFESGP